MEFGGNDDGHLRGEEALRASVVKVDEVVEAENAAAAKIAAETVETVDLPCLSSTTRGHIKRGIDGQERITWDRLRRKGASFFSMGVCLFFNCFVMKLSAIELV